jgi:hypothetical protein
VTRQQQIEADKIKKAQRRERKKLEMRAEANKLTATKALEDYAKLACRKFCDVYTRFPREIRTMIYSHIHRPEDVYISANYFKLELYSTLIDCKAPEHIWSKEYVGEQVHLELCEQFYHSTTFAFDSTENELLLKFRITDRWMLGQPPFSFVTNVRLGIKIGDWFLKPEKERNKQIQASWGNTNSWGSKHDWDSDASSTKKSKKTRY